LRAELVCGEPLHEILTEGDGAEPRLRLRLRVLTEASPLAPDVQVAALEVDVMPLESGHLSEPEPGRDRDPQEERVVLPGLGLPSQVLARAEERDHLSVAPLPSGVAHALRGAVVSVEKVTRVRVD